VLLLRTLIVDKHGGIQDVLIDQPGSVALLDLERHSAAADAFCLIADGGHGLASDADIQPVEPSVQAFPEFDFPAICAQSLGLEVAAD
jgi:hypothetical protein